MSNEYILTGVAVLTNLYRQVDPASGRIVIDGIDISKIGLHDLRSRIVCTQMIKLI
jgi:ABC-type multidrug transport system fused ATPase/permease subunit